MEIKMKKTVFDSHTAGSLGHACFAPMVAAYQAGVRGRAGMNPQQARISFFHTLSPGQKALFIFFTYYDHAIRSEQEFLAVTQNYLRDQLFEAVQKGVWYFGDDAMHALLLKIGQALAKGGQGEIPALYRQFRETAPGTLTVIGIRIKENPSAFICLE
ncbi:MAG TPA: hypothetical protein DEB31_06140 [Clostridiales bacterium]|nr:hypothetical protein [Clostridiales bacterium]